MGGIIINTEELYFEWLQSLIDGNRYSKTPFTKLLTYLHDDVFTWTIPKDDNRAEDGIDLRYRFAIEKDILASKEFLENSCSVLEMMVALSVRCEEDIMDNARLGNRTGQWFWGMLNNLGLGAQFDSRFDEVYTERVIERFLNRDYEPDGTGGLFTVNNTDRDLRDVEIWYQLCWYLDSFS